MNDVAARRRAEHGPADVPVPSRPACWAVAPRLSAVWTASTSLNMTVFEVPSMTCPMAVPLPIPIRSP